MKVPEARPKARIEASEKEEESEPIEIHNIKIDEFFKKPGFVDFMAKYDDDLDPEADAQTIQERFYIFESAERLCSELTGHFRERYERQMGIKLDAAHYEAMKDQILEMAAKNRTEFQNYFTEWRKYKELPQQIESIDHEINAMKPEKAKEDLEQVRRDSEVMELASQKGIGDSVSAFFSNPEKRLLQLNEAKSDATKREFYGRFFEEKLEDFKIPPGTREAFEQYVSGAIDESELKKLLGKGSVFLRDAEVAYERQMEGVEKEIEDVEALQVRLEAVKHAKARGVKGFALRNMKTPTIQSEKMRLEAEIERLKNVRMGAAEKAKIRRKMYWSFVEAEEQVMQKNEIIQKMVASAKEALVKQKENYTRDAKKAVGEKNFAQLESSVANLSSYLRRLEERSEFADLRSEDDNEELQQFIEDAASAKLEAHLSSIDVGDRNFGTFIKSIEKMLAKNQIGRLSSRETSAFIRKRVEDHIKGLGTDQESKVKKLMLRTFLAKIKKS
ncbi:MAG: hypothetical protein HYV68_02035 [Candidatus Taylorbacteria bacterium]|nr:hypothetical protein [Candidatus Taylorbacteria bacterium]